MCAKFAHVPNLHTCEHAELRETRLYFTGRIRSILRANVKNRSPRDVLEVASTRRTTTLRSSVSPPPETDGTLDHKP